MCDFLKAKLRKIFFGFMIKMNSILLNLFKTKKLKFNLRFLIVFLLLKALLFRLLAILDILNSYLPEHL